MAGRNGQQTAGCRR